MGKDLVNPETPDKAREGFRAYLANSYQVPSALAVQLGESPENLKSRMTESADLIHYHCEETEVTQEENGADAPESKHQVKVQVKGTCPCQHSFRIAMSWRQNLAQHLLTQSHIRFMNTLSKVSSRGEKHVEKANIN